MSILNRIIAPVVEKAVKDALDSIIIERVSRPGVALQRRVFEACVAGELLSADQWMSVDKAKIVAHRIVQQLVDDAGEYGAPDYLWDRQAAVEMAHELEIRFWGPTNAR